MSEQSLTTQVTASTEVARSPPTARAVDEWGAIALVAGGAIVLLTLLNGLLSLVDRVRSWFKEGEKEEQGALAKVECDVKELQAVTRNFMPEAKIMGEIEHEKTNRRQGEQLLLGRVERCERDIGDMRVVQGQLLQQANTFAKAVRELKTLVKDMTSDLGGRIDRLQPRG